MPHTQARHQHRNVLKHHDGQPTHDRLTLNAEDVGSLDPLTSLAEGVRAGNGASDAVLVSPYILAILKQRVEEVTKSNIMLTSQLNTNAKHLQESLAREDRLRGQLDAERVQHAKRVAELQSRINAWRLHSEEDEPLFKRPAPAAALDVLMHEFRLKRGFLTTASTKPRPGMRESSRKTQAHANKRPSKNEPNRSSSTTMLEEEMAVMEHIPRLFKQLDEFSALKEMKAQKQKQKRQTERMQRHFQESLQLTRSKISHLQDVLHMH
ncbi:hypothetical protein HDU85_003824 [Gaertneriomyces sp. JEL0708]|nr:hypothetical protein HDU85_003824 [Gaertneriomyces sp. JEL0708]